MKLNIKMLIYILSASMIVFIVSMGYITAKSRQLALEEAREIVNRNAHEYANYIKSELASDFKVAKTLAQSAQAYQSLPWDEWNKIYLEQQLHVITENSHYLAVATSWELNHIDPSWGKTFGRYLNGWVRDKDGNINQIELRLNTEGDDFRSNYYTMKSKGNSMIIDPEIWSPTGNIEDQYINTNFSVPIKLGNTFIGLAGFDVDLQKFREVVENIKPFKNSYAFLMSNNGTYVTHPNHELAGKLMSDVHSELNDKFDIVNNIKLGRELSFTFKDESNQKKFYAFAPIKVEGVNAPWAIAIVVPYSVITLEAKRILYNALFAIFIGMVVLTFVIWIISKNITNPILKVTEILKNLAKGDVDEFTKMEVKSKDEIGEMALALNASIQGINKKTAFANQIGSGNIDHELELLSNEDMLGHSLIQMRNSLLKAKADEEKRKIEDDKRQWINEGLAKFADILRKDNDNLNSLANAIIKNLVYYLDVNQGGIFILNDQEGSEKIYDLLAAFAYDREKFIKKRVELGEGLVGTCAKEKNTIYLTEIPEDYINITSGLGESTPNSLLIIPLIMENEVLGVIELASFKKFRKHEIEFAERVSESIGSTLKSVRINTKTTFLLEQSQQQAEEMSAQEEEMRQNMEELQATQEESDIKSEEFSAVLSSIDNFLVKVDFDLNFTVIDANERFLKKFDYKMKEVLGMEAEDFIAERDIAKFHVMFNKVMSGKSHRELTFLKSKKGKEIELLTSFAPVIINGNFEKILFLGVDINAKE